MTTHFGAEPASADGSMVRATGLEVDGSWDDALLSLLSDLSCGDFAAARLDVKVEQLRRREWRNQVDRLTRHMRRAANKASSMGFWSKVTGAMTEAIGTLVSVYCPPAGQAVKVGGAAITGGLDIDRSLERGRERRLAGRTELAEMGAERQGDRLSETMAILEAAGQAEGRLHERIAGLCSQERDIRLVGQGGGR